MGKRLDYLIVGAGFFGSICARELTDRGYDVLVIDSRVHIGGNCYTQRRDGINLHMYGPHIFHTSNKKIWDYVNQFVEFNNYIYSPVAYYQGKVYPLPFNMHTFSALWGVTTPEEAERKINSQKASTTIENLEQQAISLVGYEVYEKLIKGYTEKQWRKPCNQLPKEIIKRLPVRMTYDSNYFNDRYQGIPIGGYTRIFETMLEGIRLQLSTNYLKDRDKWNSTANRIIYTGAIDAFFEYKYGHLEYKTTRFDHIKHEGSNKQGISVINYTDKEIPYTRTIEHKHFESGNQTPVTWVTTEYPTEYKPTISEPYYPVNDKINNNLYAKYKALADETNVVFGGRLAEYKYYDMHNIIDSALNTVQTLLS